MLAEPERIVRGMVSGSAAAVAGLHNGDEIVDPVPQVAIQGEQSFLSCAFAVQTRSTLVYLPRGEVVDVQTALPLGKRNVIDRAPVRTAWPNAQKSLLQIIVPCSGDKHRDQ